MDDITAISQLKYRYLRTLDTKDWDGFAACFLPEATGDYNGLVFDDRDALVTYMRDNLGDGMLTMHQVHHPEIDVDGDTASARWYLQDKVIVPAFRFMLEGAAFYSDRYQRTSDGWRVSHTGYRRTFEITYDLADLPGTKVKGPGEHTHV
ncbi:nuclear transport factor 2 family protein [Nocardioides sp. YIM 152315]|uniref:nuclear transport factor 2 family protein n=1 Tax=Nocardioides sp. YIM 152315 TaxID=3031760 RepID=UPI0023DBCD71|nr:nuclear transport factor 2 family protein [Nocardioides sp. YIM 152315]MDF1605252.1 nuclear transport factor 2 family protein [Nocardioides sp. YIM 152315]